MAEYFAPERVDEAKFIYQLIIPIDESIGLHITLKRRFRLADRYTREQMISETRKIIFATDKFTVQFGDLKAYDDGLQYYDAESVELGRLRDSILDKFGDKVISRDPHYEHKDSKFHVSVETLQKRIAMKQINSLKVEAVKMQVGARGEINKYTESFILR